MRTQNVNYYSTVLPISCNNRIISQNKYINVHYFSVSKFIKTIILKHCIRKNY